MISRWARTSFFAIWVRACRWNPTGPGPFPYSDKGIALRYSALTHLGVDMSMNGSGSLGVSRFPLAAFAFAVVTTAVSAATNFVNFETAPVHPIALGPDARTLALCNLPDNRVEFFDVSTGIPVPTGSVAVG